MPATILAVASFLIYGIAVRAFFGRPDGVRPGMQLIQVLALPASVLHVLMVSRTAFAYTPVQFFAVFLYGAGIGLFAWAWLTVRRRMQLPLAFSRTVPSRILAQGPFGHMRHPFYTAYVLTWSAGALYTSNGWLLFIAIAFSTIYLVAIGYEERLLLAGASGLEYGRYRTLVGLIPCTSTARSWRLATAVLLFLTAFLPVTGVALALRRLGTKSAWLRSGMRSFGVTWNGWVCRKCLSIMNVGATCDGAKFPGHPCLVVSNHISWLDVFVLGAQGRFIFVAADNYGQGILGAALKCFGTIFLSRSSQEGLPRFSRSVRETLAAGYSVVVFPEGGTSDGSTVLPFYSSPFEAALEAGVPVVPVAIEYETHAAGDVGVCWVDGDLWQHATEFLRRQAPVRASLHISEPLQPWFTTRKKLADEARRACAALLRVPVTVTASVSGGKESYHGPPLPLWFKRLLTDLASIEPGEIEGLSLNTRVVDSGLDSLSILALQEQLLSLGVRTPVPWSCELTFAAWLAAPASDGDSGCLPPEGWDVRRANLQELPAAGKLRYRVYVQELGRPFGDETSQILLDPLDESGQVLIAMGSTGVVATCRLNWGNDPLAYEVFGPPLRLDLHSREHDLERIAIVSKLAIDPQFRANPHLLGLLLKSVLQTATDHGCSLLVAHTRASLTTVFARAGFKVAGEPYFDHEWGGWQRPIAATLGEVCSFSQDHVAAPFAVRAMAPAYSG